MSWRGAPDRRDISEIDEMPLPRCSASYASRARLGQHRADAGEGAAPGTRRADPNWCGLHAKHPGHLRVRQRSRPWPAGQRSGPPVEGISEFGESLPWELHHVDAVDLGGNPVATQRNVRA